jgi:hypothetical protein
MFLFPEFLFLEWIWVNLLIEYGGVKGLLCGYKRKDKISQGQLRRHWNNSLHIGGNYPKPLVDHYYLSMYCI